MKGKVLRSGLHQIHPVIPVLSPHSPHYIFTHPVQFHCIGTTILDCTITNLSRDGNSLLSFDLASNVAVDEVMLTADCPIPRLVLREMVVVGVISTSIGRCNDVEDILICFKETFPPQHVCILISTLNMHAHTHTLVSR